MVMKGALLLAIGVCGLVRAEAVPPGSFTVATASVETVISAVDGDYRFHAYVVRWHDARVLVSDPLAASDRAVGDNIRFIASRHEAGGNRLLSFTSVDQDAQRSGAPAANATADSSVTTATAPIEEVLSAEEEGYRFTAYLVKWHDAQIGISDVLSRSHAAVGDPIGFLAIHTTVAGEHLLAFNSADQPPAAVSPGAQKYSAPPASPETGLVDEVLAAESNGYPYRAYVIQWHGSRIVIADEGAATQYKAGDNVTFRAQRMPNPLTGPGGILSFLWNADHDDSAAKVFAGQASTGSDTAKVDEVLTAAVDGYRYIAYIVTWHGARVAISDMLATTHYAAGDRITFPVARAESSGQRSLSFMLFDFPRGGAAPDATHAAPL
jgi:hypothetical protein